LYKNIESESEEDLSSILNSDLESDDEIVPLKKDKQTP
jgi:hypothetical protein